MTPNITWDIAIALRNNWFNWNRVWLAYGMIWFARWIVGGNMFIMPIIPKNYHVELVPNGEHDEYPNLAEIEDGFID